MLEALKKNHFLFKNVCVVLFTFLSLVAVFFSKDDDAVSNLSEILLSDQYQHWLFASFIVAGPLLINVTMDSLQEKIFDDELITRVMLTSMLFIPDLVLFIYSNTENHSDSLHGSFVEIKLVGITCCLLNSGIVEKYVSSVGVFHELGCLCMFFFLLGKVFLTVSDNTGYMSIKLAFYYISAFIYVLSGLALISSVCLLCWTLWPQIQNWSYNRTELKAGLYQMGAILFFLLPSFVFHFGAATEEISYLLILQVALTYFLTVLLARTSRTLAQEREKMLEERQDLMRYIVHETRTPMNSASLGLSVAVDIAEGIKDALLESIEIQVNFLLEPIKDQIRSLSDVQDSLNLAVSTLDDILSFDKLSENKNQYADFNPWRFLIDVSQPFLLDARKKEIELEMCCIDHESNWHTHCMVYGDAFKLGQVMRNLISNALKFTGKRQKVTVCLELLPFSKLRIADNCSELSGNTLTNRLTKMKVGISNQTFVRKKSAEESSNRSISLDHEENEKPTCKYGIRISVQDSGVGISKENQELLFGRYVQIKPGELQQGKGSGLGLWISKKIVEKHGGQIWMFSEGEGHGSSFNVELPIHFVEETKNPSLITFFLPPLLNNKIKPDGESVSLPAIRPEAKTSVQKSFLGNMRFPSIRSADPTINRNQHRNLNTNLNDGDFENLSCGIVPHEISPNNGNDSKTENETRETSFRIFQESSRVLNTLKSDLTPNSKWDVFLHFMVVDDSSINRKLLKQALERQGHSVVTAEDGQECVDSMKSLLDRYNIENDKSKVVLCDVVLIDDQMPRLSGVEATRRLRDMGFKGLIYGVTGDSHFSKKQEFLENGANEVIIKPLHISVLREKIMSNLK